VRIRALLQGQGLQAVVFCVELLAREFLNNAILHGNQRDAAKHVTLQLRVGRRWIHLRVVDEGAGFAWRRTMPRVLPEDTADCGRGLAIGARYADRVRYNRRGNAVSLRIEKDNHGGRKCRTTP
jgi:serine/threonine-protein kinase RsbW